MPRKKVKAEPEVPAIKRIVAPRLEGTPEFPEPGLYFGMPEDHYHAIHACSASGLKALSISSMDYWAKSALNPEKDDDDKDTKFKALGRAYHVRICEGRKEFYLRYAVALDAKTDFPNQIMCVTIADIRKAIEDCGGKPKGTAKGDLIAQLIDWDNDSRYAIWDLAVEAHAKHHAGKIILDHKQVRRIEIAARMIENDPQLAEAFTNGHAEVSAFWYDEETGVPCKARFDFLKLLWLIDLKSFGNQMGRPVQRAIDMAISTQKYFIPVVFYLEAIAAVKKLIRETKGACVHAISWIVVADSLCMSSGQGVGDEKFKWAWEWAHQEEPGVLFVFQQTGISPVTRGRVMPQGTTFTVTQFAVQALKAKWLRCAQTFGTDPWVDIEPITRTEDESLTFAATDFGGIE